MYRKVTVDMTIRVLMLVDEGVEISEVVDKMNYQLDLPYTASLEDSEITGYEVKDSK